jgi:hypothetical protein
VRIQNIEAFTLHLGRACLAVLLHRREARPNVFNRTPRVISPSGIRHTKGENDLVRQRSEVGKFLVG